MLFRSDLAPAAVAASLDAAPAFFAEHFPDVPVQGVHCHSWMLDPRLPQLLPGSNLAAFQQRWRIYGEAVPGDQDALFFGFAQPGPADPERLLGLEARTRLQRSVLELWRAGDHWRVVDGRIPA